MSTCTAASRPHAAWVSEGGGLSVTLGEQFSEGTGGGLSDMRGVTGLQDADLVVMHDVSVCPVFPVPVRVESESGTVLQASAPVQPDPLAGVVEYAPTARPGSGVPQPVCTVTVACVESSASGALCLLGPVQPTVGTVLHPLDRVSESVCVPVGLQVGGSAALPEPESARQSLTPHPGGQERVLQSDAFCVCEVEESLQSHVRVARTCMGGRALHVTAGGLISSEGAGARRSHAVSRVSRFRV